MRNLNHFIINFILPIIVLFIAFRVSAALGWAIILGFLVYVVFKSKSDIFAHLGNLKYMKGDEEGAYKLIRRAAEAKGCKPKILTGYGFLLLKRGEVEEAERVLTGVINSAASKEDKNNARINLALAEWKKGRLYNAVNILQEIYADFKNTNLYCNLGFLYILKGDYEKALKFNLEAFDYNEGSNVIMNNLGLSYLLLKDFNKAEEIYDKLLHNEPKFAEAFYYSGVTKLNLNKTEEGRELLKKSLNYGISLQSTLTKEEINSKLAELV